MLEIEPETVTFLILKAREFDDKDPPGTPAEDTTPAEEAIEADMHYSADDPVAQQIGDTIEALNDNQQAELVALAWIGRGDYLEEGLIQLGLTVEDLEPARTSCWFRWRGRKSR